MKPPRLLMSGHGWDPPDKEWLEHQCITLGKSRNALHLETGAHWCTVSEWLEGAGIPSRDERLYQASGSDSPFWKGGCWATAHKQARQVMLEAAIPKVCADCGTSIGYIGVHHLDGNENNNALDNLQYLCKSCHKLLHPRKENKR